MTDIQRHLKGIRKILLRVVETAAPDDPVDLAALTRELRTFLPRSYGIGSGVVTGPDGTSQPVQLLLYDVPLAQGAYDESSTAFRIEHVLLVLDFARLHTPETFHAAVERLASVKQLQTLRLREPRSTAGVPGQTRRVVPKDRLPFALIYFDRLENAAAQLPLAAQLHQLMHPQPVEHWPDQIDAIGQQAQFLNPLLTDHQTRWYDMGWSRTPDLRQPAICYSCKSPYFRQHFFYDQLCLRCGDLNYQKRVQTVDLTGYYMLVTGARVKIGYETALRLLRAGATVIVTSRFPHDTARRYAQEADFPVWSNRLHIYGLDLRQVPRLESFIHHLEETYPYLDAIINNAAQTIKRPAAFYAHLLPLELMNRTELPDKLRSLLGGEITTPDQPPPYLPLALPGAADAVFPPGQLDEHGQQIDNRDFNSWVMRLEDVSPLEMVEVQLVNAIAPAILAGQLKLMLRRSPHSARFIVNVSAAEGRFSQFKNGYHPHTNMAKAALNMLTRTTADAYAADRIYVTSADPGWVSDQTPRTGDEQRAAGQRRVPIDMVDAAARVCDPIFSGVHSGQPLFGKLLKDYEVVEW